MMRRLTLVLGAMLLWAALPAGQQAPPPPPQTPVQQPRFRSSAEIVRLDISVIDRDRMPVRGLQMGDFTVLENGKPQPLSAFAEVQVADPIVPTTAWMRDVEPDIKFNGDLNDRRLILIVMDDAQVPAINVRIGNNVKAAGRAIIDQLGPADLCAVVYTMDQRNMQEFTSDRARLLAAIDRFSPGGGGPTAQLFDSYSVGTLRRAAEFLSEIPNRRKALFYISTGVAVDAAVAATPVRGGAGGDQAGRAQQLIREVQEVFREAQMANVNIHAIDPSALEGGAAAGGFGTPAKDFLITLSENTGGFPIVNRDDYQQAIAQVFLENSSYYLLGYEPTAANDGRYRRLEVKVNRPGLTVRARSGYYAPDAIKAVKPGASTKAGPSPLYKAISGILPVGDLPLQVTAAPFSIPGKKESTVAIVLGIVQDADTGDVRQVEKVEFLIDAFGQDGSSKSAHGLKADVTLKPNIKGKVGYEVLSRIDLKPGRYQLRLSAHLPGPGTSGSVYYDVDVPDYSKSALAMSGAMMSVTPSVHASPRDKLADVLPIVPTTARHYAQDDVVTSFVKVYQPKGDVKPVVMASRITDSKGAVVVNRVATLPVLAFGGVRSAGWRFAVPVATLKPGVYLLTFEATLGTVKATREVRFTMKGAPAGG